MQQYGVTAAPAMLGYKDEARMNKLIGPQLTEPEVKRFIEKVLLGGGRKFFLVTISIGSVVPPTLQDLVYTNWSQRLWQKRHDARNSTGNQRKSKNRKKQPS
jgi:hypothetical protein